MAIFEA